MRALFPTPRTPRRAALGLVFALGVLLTATVALAAALVHVQVRNANGEPVEGRVTLTARSGGDNPPTFSCETQGGDCSIDSVPGGQYVATFAPRSGDAPAPRNVMIPPAGTVRLRVSAQ